ncbi:MAG TPA: flagellar biosynthesis anti-sigma factor FlgM [Methylibium sp.]|uniref:flagellar biosynthesis anti-sigma factor FlgM n=1 Tax=Methylibium sp. TaxID=2067992 RepID=UPI002DBB321C|nr:flagellar biosynthesis anti-sigma factor FlgM [Methylibium sp.]HEU4457978.1 flagellar biosynthesis anti-sigma factor FlgM [Methylibium sp.]
MKIDQPVDTPSTTATDAATLARANAEAGAAAKRARTAKQPEASSSVSISATATQLIGAATGGEFDAAKVERLRREIADGTYRIDAEKIADKLIANAQEALSAVRR